VYDRNVPIRGSFIRRSPWDDEPPPLARMIRGGRGGGVRLKLFLGQLWIASRDPYNTNFPAHTWAALQDLPDPYGLGARRINDAVRWLEHQGFLKVAREIGEQSEIRTLREDGTGQPYYHPGDVDVRGDEDRYVWLPPGFFLQGWAGTLSASAIAILLILRDQQPINDLVEPDRIWKPSRPLWVSPRVARELYALSEDTWTSGTKELRRHKIIRVQRVPVGGDFERRYRRNRYTVRIARLSDPVA
jgi:hypothetical protein